MALNRPQSLIGKIHAFGTLGGLAKNPAATIVQPLTCQQEGKEVGSGERGARSEERGAGSGERGAGSGERGVWSGSREPGLPPSLWEGRKRACEFPGRELRGLALVGCVFLSHTSDEAPSPARTGATLPLGIGIYTSRDEVTAGTSHVREYVVAFKKHGE